MQSLLPLFLCFLPFIDAEFTATDRVDILNVHNQLRSSISAGTFGTMPVAKVAIPDLTWSPMLEAIAQLVSNKCVLSHTNMPGLGLNLYMAKSSNGVGITGKGKAASQFWAKEFQNHGLTSTKFTPTLLNNGVRHATQMIWSNTTTIGCGATLCKHNTRVLVACLYDPQGNILNHDIYNAK